MVVSEAGQLGQIVWLTVKRDALGTSSYEVIYELDTDPDNLQQMIVREDDIYQGAKRHDRVYIMQGDRPVIRLAQ